MGMGIDTPVNGSGGGSGGGLEPIDVGVAQVKNQEEFQAALDDPDVKKILITQSWTQVGTTSIGSLAAHFGTAIELATNVFITLGTTSSDRWLFSTSIDIQGANYRTTGFLWAGQGNGVLTGTGIRVKFSNIYLRCPTNDDLGGRAFVVVSSTNAVAIYEDCLADVPNNGRLFFHQDMRCDRLELLFDTSSTGDFLLCSGDVQLSNVVYSGEIAGGVELLSGWINNSDDSIIDGLTIRATGDADSSGTPTRFMKGGGVVKNVNFFSDASDFDMLLRPRPYQHLKGWHAPGLNIVLEQVASNISPLIIEDCVFGNFDASTIFAVWEITIKGSLFNDADFVISGGSRGLQISDTDFTGNVLFAWQGAGTNGLQNRVRDVFIEGTMTINADDLNVYKDVTCVGVFTNNSVQAVLKNTGRITDVAAGAGTVTVETIDGSITSADITKIRVPNGSLALADSDTTATINNLPRGDVVFGQPSLASLNSFIVAAWSMDDVATPITEVKRNYTLNSFNGTPLFEQTGKFGDSIQLGKANGCLSRGLNNVLGFRYGTPMTFVMWVAPTAPVGERGYLLNFYINGTNRTYFFTSETEIKLVNISNGSALQAIIDPGDLLNDFGINFFDGNLHLVVGMWDTSDLANITQKLWIDNQLVINVTAARSSFSAQYVTGNVTIAGENQIANSGFGGQRGRYDEIILIKAIIEASQVNELWNGGQGVSLTVSGQNTPRFNDANISDFNGFIQAVWLLNEAAGSNSAADSLNAFTLQAQGTITRGVPGRFPGTLATRFTPAGAGRLARYDRFVGPDANTEFVMTMQVKIYGYPTGSNSSRNSRFFEIGNFDSNGGGRESLSMDEFGILSSYNGGPTLITMDISAAVGDGNFHRMTIGRRRTIADELENFLVFDDQISTSIIAWPDLSSTAIDIAIGRSIIFNGYPHNQAPDADIHNVVLWQGKGCSMSNDALLALNNAQLQFSS